MRVVIGVGKRKKKKKMEKNRSGINGLSSNICKCKLNVAELREGASIQISGGQISTGKKMICPLNKLMNPCLGNPIF